MRVLAKVAAAILAVGGVVLGIIGVLQVLEIWSIPVGILLIAAAVVTIIVPLPSAQRDLGTVTFRGNMSGSTFRNVTSNADSIANGRMKNSIWDEIKHRPGRAE